jgi:hypothetical protein
MEKQEKIRAGSGKTKGEGWLQVTVNPDVISQHIQEFNGKKYVKLNVNIGKPDKYGKDVSISIDTWVPNGAKKETASSDVSSDSLPF